jgi:alanine transaminase
MELHNIDPFVQTQLYKLASSGLCAGVAGQMMMSLMVRPPLPSQESYELFAREESAIFESLKRRAMSVSEPPQSS